MSRSRKDGRHRGGHVDQRCPEFWSRRCPSVNGSRKNAEGKRITHRWERRVVTRQIIAEQLADLGIAA